MRPVCLDLLSRDTGCLWAGESTADLRPAPSLRWCPVALLSLVPAGDGEARLCRPAASVLAAVWQEARASPALCLGCWRQKKVGSPPRAAALDVGVPAPLRPKGDA